MDQSIENKLEFKDRLVNFYKNNKIKIYVSLFILLIALISLSIIKYFNEKKNILISEKYIQAGLFMSDQKQEKAKKIYNEIIFSKNEFYSILALNTILEKNLVTEEEKILEYFSILEKTISNETDRDLISLKKGLYLIKKKSDKENGEILLQNLIDKDSNLKFIALEILKK